MTAKQLAEISVRWACESVQAQRELLALMEDLGDTDTPMYQDAKKQLAYWEWETAQRKRTLDELA